MFGILYLKSLFNSYLYVAVIIFFQIAFAQNLYVAETGNDNNNGSILNEKVNNIYTNTQNIMLVK